MIREVVKVCGADRASIESRLAIFADSGVSFEVDENCLDAKITMSTELPFAEFDRVRTQVYDVFENEVYSAFDESLQTVAARLLIANKRVLGVAESLTGGQICSLLAEIPGISGSLYEGVVCYNSGSKMQRLGVSKSTLDRFGAISRETALAMVKGITCAPVDLGLATTGLAGPDGDEGKPVGLVYIAVGCDDFTMAFECNFKGDRNTVRLSASHMALYYLIRYLKGDIMRLQ